MRVDTPVGPLNVTTQGQGKPILFWPSLFLDAAMWQAQVEAVRATHQAIVIDGPGHGQSGAPPGFFSQADCAAAAFEVLAALSVTSPVTVVGCSWGGLVGVEMALAKPDRVAALVLANTPLHAYRGGERLKYTVILAMHRLLGARTGPGTWSAFFGASFLHNKPELDRVTAGFMAADHKAMNIALRATLLKRRDLLDRLGDLSLPVLAIGGTEDKILPSAVAQHQASLIPRAQYHALPDAGHVTPVEQPAAFNALMLPLLDEAFRLADAHVARQG